MFYSEGKMKNDFPAESFGGKSFYEKNRKHIKFIKKFFFAEKKNQNSWESLK